MDDLELRSIINSYIKEICHFSQMQVFATSYYQKNYFQMQMDDKINGMVEMILQYYSHNSWNDNLYAYQQNNNQGMIPNQDMEQGQDRMPNQDMTPDEEMVPGEEMMPEQEVPLEEERIFTAEELAEYNGANGSPAYVAVNGIVYDVTMRPAWAGGTHFGMTAGRDLTAQFMGCHQGVLQRLEVSPVVGLLRE